MPRAESIIEDTYGYDVFGGQYEFLKQFFLHRIKTLFTVSGENVGSV